MKYTEILKLKKMLEDAKIPFDFQARKDLSGYQMRYPSHQKPVCSIVEHKYSYGAEDDLLEIMGLLTDEEMTHDSVVGYLTAEEVFTRINQHYSKQIYADKKIEELKPCPFCGSEALVVRVMPCENPYVAVCQNEKCGASIGIYFDT